MAINFPLSPSIGQLYTFAGSTWEWSGEYWEVYSGISSSVVYSITTDTGLSADTITGNVTLLNTLPNYAGGVLTNYSGWTNNGNGTMNLPSVQVALYDNTNFLEPLRVYTVASGVTGSGGISGLTDNDTNYIYIEYNNGSPRWVVSTDNSAINGSTVVRFQNVYRIGNFINNLEWGNEGAGLPNKIANRIDSVDRFARESGLSLGLSGSTGVVTLSSGVAWNGTLRQSLDPVNSQTDIFFQNFHSGGTWVISTTADTLNNTYYDDGTDRVVASAGTYLVNWYFRGQEISDHLYEVWGNTAYTSVAAAQLSLEPALSELITSHAFLLGRIIVEQGALTGFVETAFVTPFQPTTVQNHNDLTGLQGGSAGEYYHLNANQYNNVALTNVNNNFSASQTINGDLNVTGDTTLNNLTANTISATTISGGTFYGDGSNLTGITNIYNSDGVLTGNRTLSGASNDLNFADLNVFKTTSGGTDIGLKLDFANQFYNFGDNVNLGAASIVIAGTDILGFEASNGYNGIAIRPSDGQSLIGDWNYNLNNTHINIDVASQLIKTINQGNDIGLKLDFANSTYSLGDFDNTSGNTKIVIDDTAQTITLSNISAGTDSNVLTIDNLGVIHSYPLSGLTGNTGISGDYLPLSGGTVTGATIFQSGLTANTITATTISGETFIGNGSGLTNVVLSVSASTGLSGNSTTGNITLINTAPDQTVTVTGGTNIEIAGSYPNFGINFTGFPSTILYYAEPSSAPTVAPISNGSASIAIGDSSEANGSSVLSIGSSAGSGATGNTSSIFIGEGAGFGASDSLRLVSIGSSAGLQAKDQTWGVFIGFGAGSESTGDTTGLNVNIGYAAGFRTKSTFSTFIGSGAGSESISSNDSIFFGTNTGKGSTGITKSVILGRGSGFNLLNSPTSIIIGQGISVQDNTPRLMNIGGILFGSGVYSGSSQSTIPTSDGKIGIGVSAPTNRLHVDDITDPLKVVGVQVLNSDTEVLTIDTNGIIHKRTYDYVTGFTYASSSNTFTIITSQPTTYSATINEMTGLTINGNLNVTGNYFVSGDTIVSGNTVFTGTTTYNTVPNAIGDFLTLPTSNVMSRRTAHQVRDDIGYYGLTFAIMNGYY